MGLSSPRGAKRLLFLSSLTVAAGTDVRLWISGSQARAIGGAIALAGSLSRLRGLAVRLANDHVLIRACGRVPGIDRLLESRGERT